MEKHEKLRKVYEDVCEALVNTYTSVQLLEDRVVITIDECEYEEGDAENLIHDLYIFFQDEEDEPDYYEIEADYEYEGEIAIKYIIFSFDNIIRKDKIESILTEIE